MSLHLSVSSAVSANWGGSYAHFSQLRSGDEHKKMHKISVKNSPSSGFPLQRPLERPPGMEMGLILLQLFLVLPFLFLKSLFCVYSSPASCPNLLLSLSTTAPLSPPLAQVISTHTHTHTRTHIHTYTYTHTQTHTHTTDVLQRPPPTLTCYTNQAIPRQASVFQIASICILRQVTILKRF